VQKWRALIGEQELESYDEHRERDERTAETGLFAAWLFPSLRAFIPVVVVAIAGLWIFNMLGESTILNDPNTFYAGTNPHTGKPLVVEGCRPERLLPEGSCDKSISLDTTRKTFPFFSSPH
jgi:hypothetical protein